MVNCLNIFVDPSRFLENLATKLHTSEQSFKKVDFAWVVKGFEVAFPTAVRKLRFIASYSPKTIHAEFAFIAEFIELQKRVFIKFLKL